VHAVHELFGLEGALAPPQEGMAEVTELEVRRGQRSR
jgi:hypothetical protein